MPQTVRLKPSGKPELALSRASLQNVILAITVAEVPRRSATVSPFWLTTFTS